MQTYSSRPGNPALKQGLLFGVITAVVEIALSFLNGFVGLGLLGSIIGLAIYLIFGLIAGQRSSVVTGKVGTGVLAGFLTGLIGSFIQALVSLILYLPNLDAIRQQAQNTANQQGLHFQYTNQIILLSLVLGLVIGIILASLLGLAGGAIGGYRGRSRAQLATPEYQESYFQAPPSQPGDGQPLYQAPPPPTVDSQPPYVVEAPPEQERPPIEQ
ncbi:MAG TPA: hypothetical protein VFA41_20210 [Ktedonobacteraceae bacterium]|nr:hypothetical protein [Ktedonobacteraceae bacterium]